MLFLFSWNSVLGGLDALVLCLHVGEKAHVELLGKDVSECAEVDASDSSFQGPECTPCTDFVLQSGDLDSIRANELASVDLQNLAVADASATFIEAELHPGMQFAVSNPTRGPPAVECAAQQVSRTVVFRL